MSLIRRVGVAAVFAALAWPAGVTPSGPSLQAQGVVPRSEYPQPQFQRADWLTLNGPWQFEFDDRNVGLDENWGAGSREFSRRITVPFSFETRLSGIGDKSFHPWVWYRRSVALPAGWKGRRVLLHFGAIDYRAEVWVNGRLAGRHEGGHVPFRFDITPLLVPGPNTFIVRAEDPPTDRSIPRGKQIWELTPRGAAYNRTSGIWQSVWLEATGESYLDRVQTRPSLDGTVRFEAWIARPQPRLELSVSVRDRDRVIAVGTGEADGSLATVAVHVPGPKLWTTAQPNLYDVVFELRRGAAVLDRVSSYFGFRQVEIRDGRVLLNRDQIYLKMVLDQGYWPDTGLTPPSDEAIQFDVKTTKELGFNGARKHQKVEDPRYLYWADRLGLLVSGEMASAHAFDEAAAERFTREWIDAVRRDQNHPSIIIWAPTNESWGVPNLSDARQQAHVKSLYWLTHALDDTRLVIDNDGWEHTDATELFAVHNYAPDGDALYARYKDFVKPVLGITGRHQPLLPGHTYNGAPLYLSEFGGIAFVPPGHQVPGDAWGYAGTEKTGDAALARLRGLYLAIARVPAFAGFCYTQLTDVEQEVNGLMTFDRKLKFDPKTLSEINALAGPARW